MSGAGALVLAVAACSSPGSATTALTAAAATSGSSTATPAATPTGTTAEAGATTGTPTSATSTRTTSPVTGVADEPTAGATTMGPVEATTAPGDEDPDAAATADVIGARTLAPVPRQTEARFSEGLAVKVTSVAETTVTARYPGEVTGSGMVVKLTYRNGSPDPVDLDGVRVNASRADGSPAPAMEGPPAAPPTGVLQPGDEVGGTYVYTISKGTSLSITLEITSVSSGDVVRVDV